MINAIAASSVAGSDAPRRGGESFSYALAAAATRENAAQALKTHGAAPAATQQQAAANAQSSIANGAAPVAERRATTENTAGRAQSAPQASQTGAAAAAAARLAPPSLHAQVATGSPSTTVAATNPRAAPPAPSAVALKEPAIARAGRAASAPAPAAPREQFATEEFARILAERLADQTRFDLDLSLEGLGRVEGRLVLGDDGVASLALAFDRAETLDQFLRDGAALRAHLEASGFAFGEGGLRLALRQDAPDAAPTPNQSINEPRRLFAGHAIDILI
jgi:hypothetical protein